MDAWPTRSICLPDCRCGFAARSSCGFTTVCWESARVSEVREVYSKPQALSQCRTWLASHLPEARTVEMASTAAAARLAAEKPGAAAIASRQAGVHYALDVIAADIEDNRHNVTRFAVIGDQSPARTGNDKTSLMFELPHQPGALADAMAIFKRNRLNLTWIESFPMPNTPNEYLFFVEFQGHPAEPGAERALAALARKTVRLEVLGSYPATDAGRLSTRRWPGSADHRPCHAVGLSRVPRRPAGRCC